MISLRGMEALTRIGFAARGVMYVLIGYLALRAGRNEDGSGALEYLAGGAGKIVLALMAVGFLAYAVWRLSEALIDTEGHGKDAKGIAVRMGGAASGLIHFALAFTAAGLAAGSQGDGSGGTEEGAATALGLPGGQLLIVAAAAALVLTGLYQLIKAARADFLKHLDKEAAATPTVTWLGRAGYAARGIVFLIVGWSFLQAGMADNAAQAGGIDDALGALPNALRLLIAAGLFLFGVFSFVEARYRRINNPEFLARLKGKVAQPT